MPAAPQPQQDPDRTAFIAAVRASLDEARFIRLGLGKFRGEGEERRCTITRLLIKDVAHLRFVTRRGRQEFTENHPIEAAITALQALIGSDYLSATLHTTSEDLSLVYSRKRVGRLSRGKPSLAAAPPAEHDRSKDYLVDTRALYLERLGVTHDGGRVKPSMYAKFRQICRFVEILDQLLAHSEVKSAPAPRIVDIGAGKGYLTFAMHDHLVRRLGKTPTTMGIEVNAQLVAASNTIARVCGMPGLRFEAIAADRAAAQGIDILVALHACDTATDDAIHQGVTQNAAMILCAPCCQHELAPQLEARGSRLEGLLKYGLLKQRQADLVTDAVRALLLEAHGYEVRVIEFASTEHTAKNLMIAAVRSSRVDRAAARAQLDQLTAIAGFTHQRLRDRLVPRTAAL